MEKVRFAVCGAGRRGSSLAADVLCMLDTVEIIAICDLSREKAEALAVEAELAAIRAKNTYYN